MGRVGRPFQGRQREERRRQARKDRARAGRPNIRRYTFSVREGSQIDDWLQSSPNQSEYMRESILDARRLRNIGAEMRAVENELLAVKKARKLEWEYMQNEITNLRHALGDHLMTPDLNCEACMAVLS